jgi:anaerobic magnesium-protoporphyrin IX monomethyl ester cyclase
VVTAPAGADYASTSSAPSGGPAVLLAHSYYLRYDDKQVRKMKPYPPLGTLITAALLRERGVDLAFFDAMLAPGVEAFVARLDEAEPGIVAIVEDDFNFLTKMCTLRMRRAALDMIAAARQRGCRVVVHGHDSVDRPEVYLAAGAHAVIIGEVEETLSELVATWAADPDADLEGITGLALPPGSMETAGVDERSGALRTIEIRRTQPRTRIADLDTLPFPAWDLIDVEHYRSAWTGAHGRLSWNMVTSRGCPYGCNWCAKPVFGRSWSQRSPADVAEELRLLREQVGPDHVWFADDIFGLTTGWIEAFAGEVTLRGARTAFTIQSRVNLMSPPTVAALDEAGAEEVWLGVESGSQKILDAMDKGTRIEQVREATRNLKAQGIRSCWFIQLGYLGEELDDLVRTRDLILEERPDEIGVSVSYPLPGTPFYDTVRDQLAGKRNWEDTDDLDMLFHGTYTSEFYKRVRDLLHDEVDGYRAGGEPLDGRWAGLHADADRYRNPAMVGG